ncbi:MAG: class I SAM-dependent methyltransferase [Bacteroidia bacterium]|nr:class I SAM-dependent methyltransferase [Bacteroidia bacterium]
MPTQDGIFASSVEKAHKALKGDIILSYCDHCGYICNEGHSHENIQFDSYDFSLAKSPSFQAYVEEATNRLINKYDLREKQILDVGCGEGYFLSQICQKGGNAGIGIDPGFNHENLIGEKNDKVSFIRDYYSKSYAHLQADFVICRLVVDLLNDPFDFLKSMRSNLETQRDTIVYFEVPNTDFNLDELCIWNLVYEHKSWYTPESLRYFFELCGFEVLDIYPCWKNEFLAIEAKPRELSIPAVPKIRQELKNKALKIAEALEEIKMSSTKRIKTLTEEGKKVVAWGAGARAVSFFNLFEVNDLIKVIVDINEKRQGKYLPGSGQLVVAPEHIVAENPDLVLITNPTYAEEIKSQARELGLDPEFWVL